MAIARGQGEGGKERNGGRGAERGSLMAVDSKKRSHRNYCTIARHIKREREREESPFANSCDSLSLDWRALHNAKCSSIQERARAHEGSTRRNNVDNIHSQNIISFLLSLLESRAHCIIYIYVPGIKKKGATGTLVATLTPCFATLALNVSLSLSRAGSMFRE